MGLVDFIEVFMKRKHNNCLIGIRFTFLAAFLFLSTIYFTFKIFRKQFENHFGLFLHSFRSNTISTAPVYNVLTIIVFET